MTDDDVPADFAAAKQAYLTRVEREVGSPITVVLAPGKSGTSAVEAALRRAGVPMVLKAHTLAARSAAVQERRYQGPLLGDDPPLPIHIWNTQWLIDHPPMHDRPWVVISSVRDPVASTISHHFQQLARFEGVAPDETVDDLVAGLAERWTVGEHDWFEFQFGQILGIDVYARPFDWDRGWDMVVTDRVRVLLLRQDRLADAHEALGALLGCTVPPLTRENVRADRELGVLYEQVLDRVRPPDTYLDEVYATRMATHFYSAAERAELRRRWGQPRSP